MRFTVVLKIETVEGTQFEIAEAAGSGGERSIAPIDHIGCSLRNDAVLHLALDVVGHEHQREPVGGRIHHAEHVHVHGHPFRGHGVAAVGGKDLGGRDAVGAVPHAVHLHLHVAVGEHPAALGVGVVAHHGDGRVVVGSADLVFVRRAAAKGGRRGRGGGRLRGQSEGESEGGKCFYISVHCM